MKYSDISQSLIDEAKASFSIKLKQLRIESKATQLEVAKAANISDRAYRSLESGASLPNFETAILLSKYFNISLDYLIGISDDPKRR